eukprot:981258-Alexandrium_andersonii.AAC.1
MPLQAESRKRCRMRCRQHLPCSAAASATAQAPPQAPQRAEAVVLGGESPRVRGRPMTAGART